MDSTQASLRTPVGILACNFFRFPCGPPIAAIVLWNTAYLERAPRAVLLQTPDLGDKLLQFLSPLGWEHLNLSGDYLWGGISKAKTGKSRPIRRVSNP